MSASMKFTLNRLLYSTAFCFCFIEVAKQLLIENSSLVYVNGDMTLCETWKTT